MASKKTSLQYPHMNCFDIIEIPEIYYLQVEEIFDVIERAHIATGHEGQDRLQMETGRKYVNITTKLSICSCQCEKSATVKKKKKERRKY